MNVILIPLLQVVDVLIALIITLLVVNAVISWLIVFDIASPRNRVVSTIYNITQRLTRPLLAPLRRFIPPVGGLDLTPLVLILILFFLQNVLQRTVIALAAA